MRTFPALPQLVGACCAAALLVPLAGAGDDGEVRFGSGAQPSPNRDLAEFTLGEITPVAAGGMEGAGTAPDGTFEQPAAPTELDDPETAFTTVVTPSVIVAGGTVGAVAQVEVRTPDGTTGSAATATVDVDMCPNERGLVKGTAVVQTDDVGTGGSGEEVRTFNIRFSGRVDDAARLTDYYRDGSGHVAERDVDAAGKETVRGAGWSQEVSQRFEGKRTVGRVPDLVVELDRGRDRPRAMARTQDVLERFDEILVDLLRKAEERWRSGYCVEVRVLEGASKGVEPKEKVKIVAQPYHKFDNAALKVPVTAKLTTGSQSVTPKKDDGPEAKFTYTAPSKQGDSGDVELRSVSKRGIGTTQLHYDTSQDLRVDATATAAAGIPTHFTGTKCGGPAGTWTVQLQFTAPVVGPVSGEEMFTLDPQTLSGPMTGQNGLGVAISGTASYDPATSILTTNGQAGGLPGTFTIPVQTGDFCEAGNPE